MKYLMPIFLLLISLAAQAQIDEPVIYPGVRSVTLIEPPSVGLQLEEHRAFMKELKQIDGFRVQIMSADRLADANKARMDFEAAFPDIDTYILFTEPNYRLRIGNLTNRFDARTLLEVVKESYPEAIIVKDQIDIFAL